MLVSIIIPAYKQEKTIRKDITNIYKTMKQTRWNFELIVVVDGFLDKSYEQARKLKKNNVTVIGYEKNHGKGYAVRYGMAHAKGDYIAFIDSGMEIKPNGISMLLEHMEWYEADIIVGSKRHPASKVWISLPRKIYSWFYYMLVRVLFNLNVRDTQAGIKVFKRKVLERVLPRMVVKEFAFDIEMLVVAKYLGFSKIYEAPVEIKLDFTDNSKFIRGFAIIFDRYVRGMLIDTCAVFYRLNILRYYNETNKEAWTKFRLPRKKKNEILNNNSRKNHKRLLARVNKTSKKIKVS